MDRGYGGWGGYGGGGGMFGYPMGVDDYGRAVPVLNDGMGDWGYGNADEGDYSDLFPGAGHGGARNGRGRQPGDPLGSRYDVYGRSGDHYGTRGDYSTIDDDPIDRLVRPSGRRDRGSGRDHYMTGALPVDDDPYDRGHPEPFERDPSSVREPRPTRSRLGSLGDRLSRPFSRNSDNDPAGVQEPRSPRSRFGSLGERLSPLRGRLSPIRDRLTRNPFSRNGRRRDRGQGVRFAEDVDDGRYNDFFGDRDRRPYALSPPPEDRHGRRERRGRSSRYGDDGWDGYGEDWYYGGEFDDYGGRYGGHEGW